MDKKREIKIIFCTLFFCCLLSLSMSSFNPRMVDDAFISFRYIDNWVNGDGLVFNHGERVEGYSNFLQVLLMAPFRKMGFEIWDISSVHGIIFSLLTVITFYFLARLFFKNIFICLLNTILFSSSLLFNSKTFMGLEVPLFSWLLTLSLVLLIIEHRWKGFPFSAIALGFLSLTRPEGSMFFLIALFLKIIYFKKGEGKTIILWMVLWCSVYVPFLLFRILYYGDLFPNTYYAKKPGGDVNYVRGLKYIKDFVLTFAFNLFGLSILISFFHMLAKSLKGFKKKFSYVALLSFLLSYVFFIFYSGGDWMGGGRFFSHIAPLLFILLGYALLILKDSSQKILSRVKSQKFARSLNNCKIILAIIFIAVVFLDSSSIDVILAKNIPFVPLKTFQHPSEENVNVYIGTWLKKNVVDAEKKTLALGDVGAIGYFSKMKILDFFGLTDSHIAHLFGAHGRKEDVKYFFNRNPDYVLMPIGFDKTSRTVRLRLRYEKSVFSDQRFKRSYEYVRSFYTKKEARRGNPKYLLFKRNDYVSSFLVDLIHSCRKELPVKYVKLIERNEEENIANEFSPDFYEMVNSTKVSMLLNCIRKAVNGWKAIDGSGKNNVWFVKLIIPPKSLFKFSVGIDRDYWEKVDKARFLVQIHANKRTHEVFDMTLNPKGNIDDRGWKDCEIDLGDYYNKEVEIHFSTFADVDMDKGYNVCYWGQPVIVEAENI